MKKHLPGPESAFHLPPYLPRNTRTADSGYTRQERPTMEAGDWTLDKMLTLMQELKEGEVLMDALSPEGFLRATLAADMGSYVDLEKGECYFEGMSFRRLLETAAGLKAVFLPEEAHAAGLADGSILLERAYVSDVSNYIAQCDQFGGEEVSWVGFPSGQGGKAVLYTRMRNRY